MFVQRDVLLRQIEMASAGLARLVAGGQPADQVDPAEVARAAGLGLDIAATLPPDAVVRLVEGDGQRLLVLGLALGRQAWEAGDRAGARQALALIDRALTGPDPVPTDPELVAAQQGLLGLAFG